MKMNNNLNALMKANNALRKGYPTLSKGEEILLKQAKNKLRENPSLRLDAELPTSLTQFLNKFPFSDYLKRVWITDDRYAKHGPSVLRAMNQLLSDSPGDIFEGRCKPDQIKRLTEAIEKIQNNVGPEDRTGALFRLAALYHDIGKCIIKERHPMIGWYMMQYIDPEEREKLRHLLNDSEEDFGLLMIVLRDHDQFGVLSTGEASFPILLNAVRSQKTSGEQKRIVSTLALCNLADIVGSFKVDGDATDRIIDDWQWLLGALEHCKKKRLRLDEYLIQTASRTNSGFPDAWETELIQKHGLKTIPSVSERVRRLLMEASRGYPDRRNEFDNEKLITDKLEVVFGNQTAKEFASEFAHICKLDYGKRFFDVLIRYCEGSSDTGAKRERMSTENVIYAVFAILKRLTTTYAAMIKSGSGAGNLIGVELKDLTPENAPEKAERITQLIISSHYPGLAWMMSDTPAWYF
jgi:hypothetical protein